MHNHQLLGNLSPQQFLQEYWQQKPLLIRQAIPNISTPFSAEELAGLACEVDSARIVIEKAEPTTWQLRSSPFQAQDFLKLPESHWTLLVNDLEQYYPELRSLLAQFNFIPDWRIDDVMVSYAADQGSVGPHTDDYDVFLIQADGQRKWLLDNQADPHCTLDNSDLCILKDFSPTSEWLLNKGDMLYLPPKLAHYGIAQGECMTYSIGFRAPNQRDLIESYFGELTEHTSLQQRFNDPKRSLQTHSAELKKQDIAQLKQLLMDVITQDDDFVTRWLGKYLTHSAQAGFDEASHLSCYQADTHYQRHPTTRFAWIKQQDAIQLYHSGEYTIWPPALLEAIQYLTENYYYHAKELAQWIKKEDFLPLFNDLLHKGQLEKADDSS